MDEFARVLATYGLPGLSLAGLTWAVLRLIDRGFELTVKVPPNRRRGDASNPVV